MYFKFHINSVRNEKSVGIRVPTKEKCWWRIVENGLTDIKTRCSISLPRSSFPFTWCD